MSNNAPPSIDPANYGSLVGLLKHFSTKLLQNMDDMLPARVIAYDRASNIAQVQPVIPFVTTDNQLVPRAQIAVPVLQMGGAGFLISFPLQTGSLGWLKANDRDISIFQQTMEPSQPNTQRKHSFEDGVFIPDVMNQGTVISGGDDNNLVIQNLAGTVKISLSETGITFTGPVTFNGPVTATDGTTINGIPFETHEHTGVQSGGDNTGGPVA